MIAIKRGESKTRSKDSLSWIPLNLLNCQTMPIGSHVTTAAVMWRGDVVIPTGECSPGVRTPHVWRVRTQAKTLAPAQIPGTSIDAFSLFSNRKWWLALICCHFHFNWCLHVWYISDIWVQYNWCIQIQSPTISLFIALCCIVVSSTRRVTIVGSLLLLLVLTVWAVRRPKKNWRAQDRIVCSLLWLRTCWLVCQLRRKVCCKPLNLWKDTTHKSIVFQTNEDIQNLTKTNAVHILNDRKVHYREISPINKDSSICMY